MKERSTYFPLELFSIYELMRNEIKGITTIRQLADMHQYSLLVDHLRIETESFENFQVSRRASTSFIHSSLNFFVCQSKMSPLKAVGPLPRHQRDE